MHSAWDTIRCANEKTREPRQKLPADSKAGERLGGESLQLCRAMQQVPGGGTT